MMRWPSISLVLIMITMAIKPLGAHEQYIRYTHPEYGYTLLVPAGWQAKRVPGQQGDVVVFTQGTHSIRVETLAVKSSDQEHVLNEQYRRLHERTARLNQIVANQPLRTAGGQSGTLQVYDYTSGSQHRLQRTMITNGTHAIYVVECSASTSAFYALESNFNRAMLSFSYNKDLYIRPAARNTERYTPSPDTPGATKPSTNSPQVQDSLLPGLVPDSVKQQGKDQSGELGLVPDK